MTEPGTAPATTPQTTPWTLRAVVAALVLEALVLAVLAVISAVLVARANSTDMRAGLIVTGLTLCYAFALAALARALARRRGRVRGLVLALQLMLAPVCYFLLLTGLPVFGVPLGVLALAAVGLLLAPPTTRALHL